MTHHHSQEPPPPLGDPDPVLSALVFTALGEASMCWMELPRGEFDSGRALAVGNKLIADIRRRGYH